LFADGHGGFDAAHPGQAQIHQHHIGEPVLKHLQRVGAVAGLGHHLQVGLVFNERRQAGAEGRMVVHEHDANLVGFVHTFHGEFKGGRGACH